LTRLVEQLGNEIVYEKDEIVTHEYEKMERVLYIEKGLLAQAVINFQLNKPLAMNLFPPQRLNGILNFFTGQNAPRRIFALTQTRAISVPYGIFRSALESDFPLYREMVRYCEIADRSELNGMIGLFTLSAEDRLKLLFVVMLQASGYHFRQGEDEWVELTTHLRHCDILRIAYISQITLSRLLASWHKQDFIRREKQRFYLKSGNLYPIYEWVMKQ
jgi:CRP-like cAMP-binding protein